MNKGEEKKEESVEDEEIERRETERGKRIGEEGKWK